MPITVTFDFSQNTDPNDRTRIRLAFQRLGWETIGGTAYRYPPLHPQGQNQLGAEDWFNHVVPALMYMRSLIERRGIQVSNFTIDAFSSTGARLGLGPEIQPTQNVAMTLATGADGPVLSENRLRAWLQAVADATA
jgi:hypothetical protein